MTDYIERGAALELLKLIEWKESSINFASAMIRELRDMPAADVKPVVRSRWVINNGRYVCMNCTHAEPYYTDDNQVLYHAHWDFCPSCGADMQKENEK